MHPRGVCAVVGDQGSRPGAHDVSERCGGHLRAWGLAMDFIGSGVSFTRLASMQGITVFTPSAMLSLQ